MPILVDEKEKQTGILVTWVCLLKLVISAVAHSLRVVMVSELFSFLFEYIENNGSPIFSCLLLNVLFRLNCEKETTMSSLEDRLCRMVAAPMRWLNHLKLEPSSNQDPLKYPTMSVRF